MVEIGQVVSIGSREYKVVQIDLNTQRVKLREVPTCQQAQVEVTFSLHFLDDLDLGRKW